MNKIVYIALSLLAFQTSIKSMENDPFAPAKIENGIIKGSSQYTILPGGIQTIHGNNGTREVYHQPSALFEKDNEYLGVVKFEEWNNTQQNELDRLIDPEIEPMKINSAHIGFHIKLGRTITYYDNNRNYLDYRRYSGPLDIKNNKDRYDLIKPHRLLDEVKQVTEDDYVISPLLYPYHSKTLTYNDDGTISITSTPKHKMIQTARVMVKLGLLYGAYVGISKLF